MKPSEVPVVIVDDNTRRCCDIGKAQNDAMNTSAEATQIHPA
jgi:hypothetical protein